MAHIVEIKFVIQLHAPNAVGEYFIMNVHVVVKYSLTVSDGIGQSMNVEVKGIKSNLAVQP